MLSLLKRLWLLLWMPLALQAQTAPGVLEYYSTSRGGGVHHLLARGQYLFAAEGSSLVVYDTRDSIYQRSFERRFTSPITDMDLHGGYLYVAANHDGLSKWDISVPIKPALVGEYKPSDFETAIQSIDFMGDTIVLAANTCVLMLRDHTILDNYRSVLSFERIGRFAEQPEGHGRVGCGVVMGHHYAAAIVGKDKGVGQGIHTYQIAPEQRLNFHHYDSAEPGKLLLLESAHRLLVFGGPAFATQSHLMGLNVADPKHPALYFCDTIQGPWGQAAVQPGILRGDTLLVPFSGHFGTPCGVAQAGVAVFSTKDPAHLRLIAQVPLPHAPLHVACVGHRLHVAMGTEGIVTYDWSRLKPGPCMPLPEMGRSRPNGGFCTGADAQRDKLLTADGDAGFTMHLIQDRKTIATRCYARLGRIDQVRILADGLHALCWVGAPLGDSLIVVRLDDGKVIASLAGPFGSRIVAGWKDRFVCARNDRSAFDILDFRNPLKPKKEQTVLLNFNNLAVDELGKLIVSTEHNIRLFDLSLGGLTDVVNYAKWGEGFGAVAGEAGIYYACSAKRGLIRFKLVRDKAGSTSLKEDLIWKLPHPSPQKMVVDVHGIYLTYNHFGLFALHKSTFETVGYYRTGLDFKGRKTEGLQDVFCRDGKVYVAEYYGQVTILKRPNMEE
jgi:hypothetical protein